MQQLILNYYFNEFKIYLFISKRVLYVVLWRQRENAVTLPHSAQRKHAFWVEIKQMPKTKKIAPRKNIALELLHQILEHRSTISLMTGDTDNF